MRVDAVVGWASALLDSHFTRLAIGGAADAELVGALEALKKTTRKEAECCELLSEVGELACRACAGLVGGTSQAMLRFLLRGEHRTCWLSGRLCMCVHILFTINLALLSQSVYVTRVVPPKGGCMFLGGGEVIHRRARP